MKPVTYVVQRYRPELEATSKEIKCLRENIPNSCIHDLHLDSIFKIRLKENYYSYNFFWYPLTYLPLALSTRKKIVHCYTGLPDSVYLPTLRKKNMIITATNYFSAREIAKKIPQLKKVNTIIIQSEAQKDDLISQGIPPEKIKVILPPVDLKKFYYQKAEGKFTILNASCPTKVIDLGKRGIPLLLKSAATIKGSKIKLLWRKGWKEAEDALKRKHCQNIPSSVEVWAGIIQDMNEEYATVHCTIIPYLKRDPYLKVIPISVIESLAAGKPVLVSSETGIAPIIEREQCGVVFQPTKEGLLQAVDTLKKNYQAYQKNCRKTAEGYFSEEKFIQEHHKIYSSL